MIEEPKGVPEYQTNHTSNLTQKVQSMDLNKLKTRFSKKIMEMNRLKTQNRIQMYDSNTLRTASERNEQAIHNALQKIQSGYKSQIAEVDEKQQANSTAT